MAVFDNPAARGPARPRRAADNRQAPGSFPEPEDSSQIPRPLRERDPSRTFFEGSQTFGLLNPVRYVSGGPSDRITNMLGGIAYTRCPVTYRCSYSNSVDANPYAIQNMIVAGATIMCSDQMDVYLEYAHERIDGADIAAQNGYIINGLEYVINWHF